jgi:NAD(P)-dependent dehydrogenase (short-subunit alcohol dehydrogenase family)
MIAEGFVRSGARVYITARKADQVQEALGELGALGSCEGLVADLATSDGRAAFVDFVGEREDRLDVLVNNAGNNWGAPLDEYPESGWDRVLGLNVKGLFELTRLFLPALRDAAAASPPARVINIGSIDGIRVPSTENYAYAASKAAVHMITRQLSRKLAVDRITVNAIAPGPFYSKMMAFLLDEHEAEVAATVPLGRIGQPEDMAGTAIFLSSRAGAYLTGTVVPVDGGIQA